MATVEKPQPMDVDPKKTEEKVEEKPELVNAISVESLSNHKELWPSPKTFKCSHRSQMGISRPCSQITGRSTQSPIIYSQIIV